ncbi:hypothetical protein Tco_0883129, partial [Tanacetum coccineum]
SLDSTLNSACQYTKSSQELLEYVVGTCPKNFTTIDNKATSTSLTRKKKGVNTSTEASGSKPRSNTKKNRILPAKIMKCSVNATPTVKIVLNKGKQIWKPKGKLSDNSLNKTKQVWKATSKLFSNVGYQWRSTGKKVALGKLNYGYQWRPTRKKFALGKLNYGYQWRPTGKKFTL